MNLSREDRIQRFVMGSMLIMLEIIELDSEHTGVVDYITLLIEAEMVLTGLIGWCPLVWSITRLGRHHKR